MEIEWWFWECLDDFVLDVLWCGCEVCEVCDLGGYCEVMVI